MDAIIDKLSALDTIWQLTCPLKPDEDEVDVISCKEREISTILRILDDFIAVELEVKHKKISEIDAIYLEIQEESKLSGIPTVLPAISTNRNLPNQMASAYEFLMHLQTQKEELISERDKLFLEALEMYKEEQEFIGEESSNTVNNNNPHTTTTDIPQWIHELFHFTTDSTTFMHCEKEGDPSTSFTSAAVTHLNSALNMYDHQKDIYTELLKVEEAHRILTGRLEQFNCEYEVIYEELKRLKERLYPFDTEEYNEISSNLQLKQKLPRSVLKRILSEWKNVEKERQESVSGSILLIGRLWDLLETPHQERFPLDPTDISLNSMEVLFGERQRLIDFQQEKFKELYDMQLGELNKFLGALRWSDQKREKLFLTSPQPYTCDGLQFLSCQIAILQPKLELSLKLTELIDNRYRLIEQMRDFERSASDPARLFRSSFQLLQEEKFRKSAYPNLIKLEDQIRIKLKEFNAKFAEEFTVGTQDDSTAFVNVFEEEIGKRFISSGIFGFDQRRDRSSSTSLSSNTNQTNSKDYRINSPVIGTITVNNNRSQPSIVKKEMASHSTTQRRKLDK